MGHETKRQPVRFRSAHSWACSLIAASAATGCARDPEVVASSKTPPADSAVQQPPMPSQPPDEIYGLRLPPALRVTRRFDDTTYLISSQSVQRVSEYLAEHVQVQHIQVSGDHSVFPRAYFKTDTSKTLVRIEVTPIGGRTQVRIKDITPPPVTGGLDEPERWQQAGRNPDGTLKDRLRMD